MINVSGIKFYLKSSLFLLILFVWTGSVMADVVTSSLTITPSPCVRGSVLHFSATVYNSPNVSGWPPGTAFYIAVKQDGSSWATENQTVKYPEVGKPVTVNFTATYTVPSNSPGGPLCFWVIQGGTNPSNKISEKKCVTVKIPVSERPHKPIKKY